MKSNQYTELIEKIRQSAKKRMLFLPHAVRQMSRPDRMIKTSEIRDVINYGEIIENYPEDARGHSCLVFGCGENKKFIHVVCSPKKDYLAIITAYIPDNNQWKKDLKTRKKI
ncbi:DUF4258 domain-containing protein [Desulfobacterales bacterium HSG17]|nr:DUF4258 domain-containing protein [Desulfobacterales bacterium HSG17]